MRVLGRCALVVIFANVAFMAVKIAMVTIAVRGIETLSLFAQECAVRAKTAADSNVSTRSFHLVKLIRQSSVDKSKGSTLNS